MGATTRNTPKMRLLWAGLLIGLVFFLKGVGEFYPFSSFPMYARLSDSAEVLRVVSAEGAIVPLHTVFGRRESRCKKIWKSKLRDICNPQGRDSSEATPDEERQAGEYVLAKLLSEGRAKETAELLATTKTLRLIVTEIALENGKKLTSVERVIAEVTP